jgi:hypothetical protein
MTRAQTKEREPAPDLLKDVVAPAPTAKPPAKTKARAEVTNLPAKTEPPNLLAAIVASASDPQKLHGLLDVRHRIMNEMAEVGYRRAYREAQARMPRIDKDGKIDEGTTRSGRQGKKARYATYENLNQVISPVLKDVGLDLSLHSEPKATGEGITMRATLSYIATTQYGELVYAESNVVPMAPEISGNKNTGQAISSALSYAKRLAVILVLNIVSYAPEDRDRDGEAVEKRDLRPTAGAAAATQAESASLEPGAKISAMQLDRLAKAIGACGVGVEKFCTHYEIEKVADLPAARFDEAIDACVSYKPKATK